MTRFGARASLSIAVLAAMTLPADIVAAQTPAARTAVLQGLMDCRKVQGDAARLACFDAAAAAMDAAEAKGDIVVVDREQARAARRQAFGFSLPSLAIFDRGETPEDLDRVSAAIARAYQQGDGKWVVELDGGAVWLQTDSEPLPRAPKAGSRAEIRKAAMGSYFMNIDGQRALRMRRSK
jgi:hypothetical protein